MPSATPRVPSWERGQRDSTSPGFGGGCARRGWRGLASGGCTGRKAGPRTRAGEQGAGHAPSATSAGRGCGPSETRGPPHLLGRWLGGSKAQGVETQMPAGSQGAAGYLLHVLWHLSALKGSWVTLSLASLFSCLHSLIIGKCPQVRAAHTLPAATCRRYNLPSASLLRTLRTRHTHTHTHNSLM